MPPGSITDWKPRTDIPLDRAAPAELVCAGGGNAYVVFKDENTFRDTTKRFLRAVLEKTCGMGIAVAAVETNLANFAADYKELQRRISLTKGNVNRTLIAGSRNITQSTAQTNEPVTRVVLRHNKYVSLSEGQYLKTKYIPKDIPKGAREFDDLTDAGNNFIGVIHADGNNMSDKIRAFVASEIDWNSAVPKLRRMSKNISAYFQLAYEKTVSGFDLPIISLVTDGEDMTFIIQGKYAVSFAAEYLRNVERLNNEADIKPFDDDETITACAGVALFHSHFPFIEAYKMAEELCSSAKSAARRAPDTSYVDFHIHSTGFVTTVSEHRGNYYPNVGKNLYSRPLRIGGGFEDFEQLTASLSGGDKYPRTKLKSLRSALNNHADGDFTDARALIKSLGLSDEIKPSKSAEVHEYALLNDALEFMDTYERVAGGVA
ncbi:MAG: hypothetical protein LBN99_04665 [Oscillospiraceae bacterium]|jgi:hypothetical protein|nr:hypothetical protein [Oscillospiraceae bacterium]